MVKNKKNKINDLNKYWLTGNRINIIIITFFVVIIYGLTAKFEFTNYDDDRLIVNQVNYLKNLNNIIDAFKNDVFNNTDRSIIFYRPFLTISFILNYKLFGLDPSAFHLVNVAIHLINTLLIYFLFSFLIKKKNLALIGALIFCVHPVQVESVAWLAGRNDLLLGLFTILMILFYILSNREGGAQKLSLIFSVIFFTIAMFSKEPAVFFGLLFVLYDFIFQSSKINTLLNKKNILKYSIFFGAVIFYLLFRYSIFGTLFGNKSLYSNSSIFEHILSSPLVVGTYLQLLALPINLKVLHPVPTISMWGGFALVISILSIIALIVISLKSLDKDRFISFGILWILFSLIPASNILPTPVPILEHRLYVPMIGFSILMVALLDHFRVKFSSKYIYFIGYFIIILLSILSYIRLPVWSNSETLWLDVIKKVKNYDLAYYNLGTYYLQNNRLQEGIKYLEQAYNINPKKSDVLMNLGYAYMNLKNYEKALEIYQALIKLEPHNEQGYIGLGNSLRFLKRHEEAKVVYQEGISKIKNSEKLHYELGLCYGSLNDHQSAEYELKKAIELNKHYGMAYFSLGGLYSHTGKDSMAVKFLEEGLKYDKPNIGVYFILSNSYLKIGDTLKASYYRNLYEKLRQF